MQKYLQMSKMSKNVKMLLKNAVERMSKYIKNCQKNIKKSPKMFKKVQICPKKSKILVF